MQMLRVIAQPGHLVADDVAYQGGARFRYVGRSIVADKVAPPEDLEKRFPPAEREYADDNAHRYVRRALQKGALLPLDAYTAKAAGVKLDLVRPAKTQKSAQAEKDAK